MLGDMSGSIRVFDKSSNKAVATLKGHKKAVTTVTFDRFTKDSDVFYSTSEDATVRMWKRSSAKKYDTIAELANVHTDGVTDLSIHPTGKYIATCSKDASWAFHEVISKDDATFAFQTHLHVKSDVGISALKFHPDGALVAIGTLFVFSTCRDVRENMNHITLLSQEKKNIHQIILECRYGER